MPNVGEVYKHFKGNTYEVINLAVHTETMKELVIYKSTDPYDSRIWARPLEMFTEWVFRDGYELPRFRKMNV